MPRLRRRRGDPYWGHESPSSTSRAMKTVAPFGAWASPVTTDLMTAAAISLGGLTVDGDALYWLEGRPSENGRTVLCRRAADGVIEDLTPAPINVGSRVHEYGGGAFEVESGVIVYSERTDGSIWIIEQGAPPRGSPRPRAAATPISSSMPRAAASWPYAKTIGVARRPIRKPRIVALPLDDGGPGETVLVKGPDFLSSPRISPDGRQLAWIAWDHPDMPWDHTRLYCAGLKADGALEAVELAAGAAPEAIVQPAWSATIPCISPRTAPAGGIFTRAKGADPRAALPDRSRGRRPALGVPPALLRLLAGRAYRRLLRQGWGCGALR